MKKKWLEREWLATLFTPVLVGILTHAGVSQETIQQVILPALVFIGGKLGHKMMIAHGAPAGQDGLSQ